MLIDKDAKPADNIYYIACCIIEELKEINKVFLDKGYSIVREKYNPALKYTDYVLALNFLYLIEKINLKEGRVNYVY